MIPRRWMCLALLAAAGCDSWLTKPSLYNSVAVTATTRSGAPIPGVPLVLYTGQRPMGYGTTDSAGRFTFTRVPQGFYGVHASPPAGYGLIESLIAAPPSTFVDNLVVAKDTLSPVHFSFLKEGPGAVTVRVVSSTGASLSGVPVDLYDPHHVLARDTSDASGRVTFDAVPYGVYGVVVTRPPAYRDFFTVNDSLYAIRDNLIVDEGVRDSVEFALPMCTAAIKTTTVDQFGAPVTGVTTLFYTSTKELFITVTGASGTVTFTQAPCATQLGVRITPPVGYSVAEGRGFNVRDGIMLRPGMVVDLRFVVQKD
jgi:hypothetical protein